MTKQQIKQEWERLRFEIIEDKPKIKAPYPQNVTLTRLLLQLARFSLCKIEGENDRVGFYESLYQRIMGFYEFSNVNK